MIFVSNFDIVISNLKMNRFRVGIVINYFEKSEIAGVQLISDLSVGDTISFIKDRDDLFRQKVETMQVGHKKVDFAKGGDVVALKTDEKVQIGTEIYKIQA